MFKKLFNKNKKENNNELPTNEAKVNWQPLTDVKQLAEINLASKNEVVAIFKHSTRCIVSSTVIKNFEKLLGDNVIDNTIYYLDLLSYREVSNAIEAQYQVMHQSPQLLLIKNGSVIFHTSHYDILEVDVNKFGKEM